MVIPMIIVMKAFLTLMTFKWIDLVPTLWTRSSSKPTLKTGSPIPPGQHQHQHQHHLSLSLSLSWSTLWFWGGGSEMPIDFHCCGEILKNVWSFYCFFTRYPQQKPSRPFLLDTGGIPPSLRMVSVKRFLTPSLTTVFKDRLSWPSTRGGKDVCRKLIYVCYRLFFPQWKKSVTRVMARDVWAWLHLQHMGTRAHGHMGRERK